MSPAVRQRLAHVVREPGCDLAEAALLCCAVADPGLDVEMNLLRIDALADRLLTSGFRPTGDPTADARALAGYLGGTLGFRGDTATYHDPGNALLSHVLEERRGLPITLSILYVAIARRVRVPAFGIGLPGHFVVGVGGGERPVVLDPFAGGELLGEPELGELVATHTQGRLQYSRNMLRPSPPPVVVRRLLNNLTRDYTRESRYDDALWTVEVKQLLPGTVPDDHRARGELLVRVGRFDEAALAFEAYVEETGDAPDLEEVSRLAVRARAKLN